MLLKLQRKLNIKSNQKDTITIYARRDILYCFYYISKIF